MNMKRNILVVDDDPIQRHLMEKFITRIGHNPILMESGKQIIDFFKEKTEYCGLFYYNIDTVLLDLSMPQIDGFEVLEKIIPVRTELPIVVLTASKETSLAIKAINLGAFDYIVKGDKDVFARIITCVNNAVGQKDLRSSISLIERKSAGQIMFSDVVAENPQSKKLIISLQKTCDSSIPILIHGENGTGKELLAKAIHGSSNRAEKPFIVVNCGAITDNTADEILFGYDKNNVVTLDSKSIGKFKEAHGGTLFLDDVGELKPETQIKLLRVLQEGEMESIGSDKPNKIDVRIISSTNKKLEDEVVRGAFRADLFYRLNVFSVSLLPLRERKDEVPALTKSFTSSFSITENKKIDGITDDAMELLLEYDWPGNIRQLRNVLFRAVVLSDNSILEPIDFPQISKANFERKRKVENELLSSLNIDYIINLKDKNGNIKNLRILEADIIEKVIKACRGNISEASKKLDLGRSTLYRKLKLENLDLLGEIEEGEEGR